MKSGRKASGSEPSALGWQALAERRIAAARRAGEFENLAGSGKPLGLAQNPHVDPAWRLALHVLRNAGYAPVWVEDRRKLEEECESTRRLWAQRLDQGAPDQEALRTHCLEELCALNLRIKAFNLSIPHQAFRLKRLRPEQELPSSGVYKEASPEGCIRGDGGDDPSPGGSSPP